MPPDLYGPLGLLIGLSAGVAALWREHLKADKDDRDQRDLAQRLLDVSLQNNTAAIAAWNRRNELDAARARRTDR